MKPKYIMISDHFGSDSSPSKSEVKNVVLEDEKGENESLSEDKVRKISSIILEGKFN